MRRQRARQRHPLRLAAGQGVHRPPAEAAQAHQLQQLRHPPAAVRGAAALHAQPEGDVALHVQVGKQRLVLKHQPEAAPVRGHGGQRPALPEHVPGMRLQAGDHPQQGGLAAPARSQQGDDLAGARGQRHVRQHGSAAKLSAHPPHFQRGIGRLAPARGRPVGAPRVLAGRVGTRPFAAARCARPAGVGTVPAFGQVHQKSRAAATRSRSMAAMLTAVVSIRMVASAMPWP